ncbi:MAG: enoyl-CoA hydratase [Gammaproteobacteria bacterium]|nr:MAG: enoyl-CoA hydratase [Gammaproteobacteria bacterium]
MSDQKPLTLTLENNIAHLVLDRPDKRNAMNKEFWQQLPAMLIDLDRGGDARVLVVSAKGKMFTAGMDLAMFGANNNDADMEIGRKREQLRQLVLDLQACFNVFEKIRMPVLGAIHGGCVGGGVDMVSAMDCRYCTEDAYFTIAETQLGMTADLGTLQRLPKLIPSGLVRELAYTGRKINAPEALRCGLVNEVFSDQEAMLDGVMSIARSIAENSPLAVQGSKEMINYARDHSVADSLNYMAAWQSGMFQAPDLMQSIAARAQKKTADYQDLPARKKIFE